MTTLVIAEKPSVARDLARVLGKGAGKREGQAIIHGDLVFTWCFGHLTEPAKPESYKPEWKNFSFTVLPMVPEGLSFGSQPRDKETASHLKGLSKLVASATTIVNACDAGREGELIFWEAMRACGWGAELPVGTVGAGDVDRMWLRSMTDGAIQEAWTCRAPISDYAPLAQAAYARQQADWLLGLNLTRAATLALVERGGKVNLWPVGRVQTPVLAEIVRRDGRIKDFKPEAFFGLDLVFGAGEDSTRARLEAPEHLRLGEDLFRFKRQQDTEALHQLITGAMDTPWAVSEEGKDKNEAPPRLFSLTSLQREASTRFGWSAKQTLEVAQGLYEGGYLTYPRTESEYLPSDAQPTADAVMRSLAGWLSAKTKGSCELVLPSASSQTQNFNDKKVTDHFAIVPTAKDTASGDLSGKAKQLWELVASRFVVAFYPDAKARLAERSYTATVGDKSLKAIAKGKSTLGRGWREVAEALKVVKPSKETELGPLVDPSLMTEAKVTNGQTKPPARYTEASLLGVMEKCGRILEDADGFEAKELQELKKVLADRGLGTPATRAEIIEGLIRRDLIERKGKGKKVHLEATSSGVFLVGELNRAELSQLTLPATTAEWETDLREIEAGNKERMDFLSRLALELEAMVEKLRPIYKEKTALLAEEVAGVVCPKTGKPVEALTKKYVFAGYPSVDCWRVVAKRPVSAEEYAVTLGAHEKGEPGPLLKGFRSKAGKEFSARLGLKEGKWVFAFDQAEPTAVAGVLCPKANKAVSEHRGYYVFPGFPDLKCWKKVAKRPVSANEYAEALQASLSNLPAPVLSGFRSKKGKTFKASLKLEGDRFGFDFGK